MFKFEIVSGSLKISKDGKVSLLYPKDSCAINTLKLLANVPIVEIFNKYLANNVTIFSEPLSSCENAIGIDFTVSTFIDFAEANLGK
jgi:hypothetical protein